MKICSQCKREKDYSFFHKDARKKDGFYCYCKECRLLKRHSFQRKCAKCKKNFLGQKSKKYCSKLCFFTTRGMSERGENNPNWKGGVSSNKSIYSLENRKREPIKHKARCLAQYAVKKGFLKRGKCERCGDANTHAHHDDYTKPLNVRWLCPKCHGFVHSSKRKIMRLYQQG